VIGAALTAVALARGPVVESVRQRSAIISFRTTVPDRSFVVLRNGSRIGAGTGVDHVVRLNRLTPGAHYEYTVETDSGVVAQGRFRAAPARAARFTFAVVGDFGSGTQDELAVASLIGSWHPDFVLTVGDNAYPLGAPELLDRDIFTPYAAVMRESAWFPALGNHDVAADGGKPELEAFHSLGKERWYRFTWGNAAVVVLDSDRAVGIQHDHGCVSPVARLRSTPASASPPGITRPGSLPDAHSVQVSDATSSRWSSRTAFRWSSSGTCMRTPEAVCATGWSTWRSVRVEPRWTMTPAS